MKVKAIDRIRKRMKEDMQEKTKCCKIVNGNWERKQYIKKCKSNTIKDMKIRLYMWNKKCNCKRNESNITCPLYSTEEATKEHIMVCQEGSNTNNLLNENEKDWEKIVTTYKYNKENREKLEPKKYQKKRHTIEGQDKTSLGKSNELIKTNRKKD